MSASPAADTFFADGGVLTASTAKAGAGEVFRLGERPRGVVGLGVSCLGERPLGVAGLGDLAASDFTTAGLGVACLGERPLVVAGICAFGVAGLGVACFGG